MTGELIVLFILLLLSAGFSATETAFTSLSMVQLRQINSKKGKTGRLVKSLAEKPDLLLTTILLGNNLVNIGASAIATGFTIRTFGNKAVGIMTGVLTLIILIFAEVSPKRIAIARNEDISLLAAWPTYILSMILRPFIFIITAASSMITRFFVREPQKKISFDALLHVMNAAEEQGLVKKYESQMVKSVFRLNDVSVQAIMTHRTDVFSMDEQIKLEDAAEEISREGFSRIPVYSKDPENVTGIVLSNDVNAALLKGRGKERLRDIMLEPIFIPENRRLHELFNLFKEKKMNISVVLDEYGGLAGIVTREDIIEEIMGELYDENELDREERMTRVSADSWKVMGDMSLHQFSDLFNMELPETEYAGTIGGYLIEKFDRIPVEGDTLTLNEAVFVIDRIEKNRILSILVTVPARRP